MIHRPERTELGRDLCVDSLADGVSGHLVNLDEFEVSAVVAARTRPRRRSFLNDAVEVPPASSVDGSVASYQFCELRVDARQGNQGDVEPFLQARYP